MNWPEYGLMEINMAKSRRRHETGNNITTPSWFGSHESMVVDHSELEYSVSQEQVVCKDDKGYYVTERKKLDTGVADPNRYSDRRFK